MASNNMTKVRFSVSGLQLDYEGREAFLQSQIPKLLATAEKLQTSRVTAPLATLWANIKAAQGTQAEVSAVLDSIKHYLDSLSETGDTESLRLQMGMDTASKLMTTLSNVMKQASDTCNSIMQNLK